MTSHCGYLLFWLGCGGGQGGEQETLTWSLGVFLSPSYTFSSNKFRKEHKHIISPLGAQDRIFLLMLSSCYQELSLPAFCVRFGHLDDHVALIDVPEVALTYFYLAYFFLFFYECSCIQKLQQNVMVLRVP